MGKNSHKTQRFGIGLLLSIFLSVQVIGVLSFPIPAKAQGAPVFDAANFSELVFDGIMEVLTTAALGALLNGASYFMRKVAYDTASYIANGGKGQSALVFKNGWGSYLEDVTGNAAASAIDQLGKPFGLDLCKMPSASFQVDLQIGLRNLYALPEEMGAGPAPSCSWQQLKKGWDTDNLDLGEAISNSFNATLSVSQSDFGIALSAVERVDRIVAKERIAKTREREEGEGFKAVTDLVSGNVKTPAQVVKEESEALTGKEQTRLSMQQIAGVYGSGALQAVSMAASVFLNTLVTQGLNNLFTKGLVPDDKSGGVADFYAQQIVNNKKAVEKAYNYLFTAVPKKQLEAYDVLSELEACPDNPGLNNCVIDSKFREIITRAGINRPLTIADAIKENLLDAEKPLISPLRIADNTNKNCRLNGYCYSNLQKLRKLRVLPLGFELAAFRSDPDKPWTLKQIVDGFDNCDPKKKVGQYTPDPKYPFCHLIDPNWVIRLPQTRCESKVFGPLLLSSNAPDRREECADISTCITEGPNGECMGTQTYAYCTREKNVWRLGANSCEPQYNTCKSYVDNKGGIRSYLSRTVNYGSCNPGAVGCRAYSLEKDASGWVNTPEVNIDNKLLGRTQLAFFNKNIANFSCPSDAEGCSAFYQLTKKDDGSFAKGTLAYLKKAPDYLGCYDADAVTAGIQFPKTPADLPKLSQSAECKKFAGACLPEETSCQAYTPKKGGPAIPGTIGANGCSESCAGYDTFKQEPTQFEVAKYPLYFVPKSGESCSAQYAGCTEFTNLGTGAQGGEQLQYFSTIKYCEKPTKDNQKTFYSWEGDQANGYVLKVHKLRPLTAADASYIALFSDPKFAGFIAGTPAYADDRKSELETAVASCNEDLYNKYINGKQTEAEALKFDPDCRALYDEAGKVSYRLLAKTITVSESCASLRKTEAEFYADPFITNNATLCTSRGGKTEGNSCLRCAGGGFFKDNSCVYSAIVGENGSNSCPAEANGCREYTGNAGNNTTPVLTSDFEGLKALDGWSEDEGTTIKISAESIQVGLHSLEVGGSSGRVEWELSKAVTEDAWYELSFWVRGSPQLLNIEFIPKGNPPVVFTENIQTKITQPISVNQTWRLYRLGPVYLPKGANKTALSFSHGSAVYFLDNVELQKITDDNLFLIKNSWKQTVNYNGAVMGADAPLICDADPSDTLPGAALGCTEYADANGNSAYATGFEQLCREEAIGCSALVDTFNTLKGSDADKTHVYNAVCSLQKVADKVTPCKISIAVKEYGQCVVQVGEKTCVVPDFSLATKEELEGIKSNITASTIVIPADTPLASPIYLTNRKEFRCSEQMLGCQKVAREEQKIANNSASSFGVAPEQFVLNNPVNYLGPSGILCDGSQVGCGEFSVDGTKTYFKDPLLTGNALCEYHDKVVKNGENYSGWFKAGVGSCANNPAKLCRPETQDNDCGKGIECSQVDEIQCYANYLEPGGAFGIWSNKSLEYQGFVGACPAEANQCTELIDPQDTTAKNPKGKPYYVIYDEDIKERIGQCTGVSLDDGCVLFDKTEDPNKKYSAILTYGKSVKEGNKQVTPQAGTEQYPGNSNLVLKVDRDRECSEWLACRSSVTQIDESGVAQKMCYDFRACDQQQNGACIHWKEPEFGSEFLSLEKYINRDTSWYGQEFVGYSVPNKYQITYYDYLNILDGQHLVYKMDEDYFEDKEVAALDIGCQKNNKVKENWAICGFDKAGRCFNGSCIYPIDKGFSPGVTSSSPNLITEELGKNGQCKAYPEKDSPFPSSVSLSSFDINLLAEQHRTFLTKRPGYQNANVCQNGDCSCSYTKIQYRGAIVTDYWDKKIKTPKEGICVGGSKEGKFCDPAVGGKEFCGDDAICQTKFSQQTHIGLSGLCVEQDLSRPLYGSLASGKAEYACMTWLPVEVNVNGLDNYNNYLDAGYNPGRDAKSEIGTYGQVYCIDAATGINGPVADSKLLIPKKDYDDVVGSVGKYVGSERILFDGYRAPTWFGSDTCKDYQSDNFALEFGSYETNCSNIVERCLIHPQSSNCGGNKSLKNHTFAQWVYSTIRNYTGSSAHDNQKTSVVWFLDNTKYWKEYYQSLANYMDGDKDNGELFSDCKAGGNSTCHQAYKYYYYIGKQLSGAENASNEPYILPSITTAVREHMIDKVNFSPFLTWLDFNHYDGSYNYSIPYYKFNKLYLNFIELQNELDKKGNSKEKGVILNKYVIAGYYAKPSSDDPDSKKALVSGSSYFNVYQGVKKMSNGNTRYLLFVVEQHGVEETTVKKVINDKFLKEEKPTASVTADGFSYTAIYMDFKPDGTIVLDTLPIDNKPRPFFIKTAFNDGFSDYFFKQFMLDRQVVASSVVLKPFCTEYRQVYDDSVPNKDSVDKAWTNRVWDNLQSKGGANVNYKIPKTTVFPPYGSIAKFGSELAKNTVDELFLYVFENKSIDGIPQRCLAKFFPGMSEEHISGTTVINFPDCGQLANGEGYDDQLRSGIRNNTGFYTAAPSVTLDAIGTLFAKAFLVQKRDDKNNFVKSTDIDFSGSVSGYAPTIYSLNPATCRVKNGSCTAAEENAFTINEKNATQVDYDGDKVIDEDPTKEGNHEAIIEKGTKGVVARFFAVADDNRMPIRRIMVNWDDKTLVTNHETYGRYKNRKPYCNDSTQTGIGLCGKPGVNGGKVSEPPTLLTCETDKDCKFINPEYQCLTVGDTNVSKQLPAMLNGYNQYDAFNTPRFGNDERACYEGYYEFTHSYTCPKSRQMMIKDSPLSEATKARLKNLGVQNDTDKVCVYKPGVQILDNWGWCNGSDENGNPKSKYGKECDLDLFKSSYTNYKGYIVIIPEK